jgi:ribosome maturation factor RimP
VSLTQSITELIEPAVTEAGFFLEEVQNTSAGSHRIVTCIVDGQTPLNLDQVTVVSRLISELLDNASFMDETPFTLEVTSPGVDRPLTLPRHWTKNLTRLVKVTLQYGTVTTGRLTEFNEATATLVENIKGRIKTHQVSFSDIKRAVVEIEFNRKEIAQDVNEEASDE